MTHVYSYDDIWEEFRENYKVDDINLPTSTEAIYRTIRSAIRLMNNELRLNLIGDNETETVVNLENEDQLIILANFIRLNMLRNDKKYYESLWQPMNSDIGLRNFGTQLNSLRDSVKEQEKLIDDLIFNTLEDFL